MQLLAAVGNGRQIFVKKVDGCATIGIPQEALRRRRVSSRDKRNPGD